LLSDGIDVRSETAERVPLDPRLAARLGRGPDGGTAQVRVRHRWPPRAEPPPDGRWVLMQPWEYGSLPTAWLPMLQCVDEVWAYSRYVRHCYLEAGVPSERVHVVPLGVDPEVFQPGREPLPLGPGPDIRFLFVGGTIFRKGIDVLLKAFARAFAPGDGVGLVIKEMGAKSFYRGQTAEAHVRELGERGYAVEYIERDLSETEMAALYSACDCLVHPFRGEGFALPVVEAMACALPVIVTGAGPALDYASEQTAYLIPVSRGEFAECRVGELETIGRPWLFEPDADALVELLKRVAGNRAEAKSKGMAASAHIRENVTWARTVDAVERRLQALAERTDRPCTGVRAFGAPTSELVLPSRQGISRGDAETRREQLDLNTQSGNDPSAQSLTVNGPTRIGTYRENVPDRSAAPREICAGVADLDREKRGGEPPSLPGLG
jgi:glycosyltransferase involved in cell wall biosynthesis